MINSISSNTSNNMIRYNQNPQEKVSTEAITVQEVAVQKQDGMNSISKDGDTVSISTQSLAAFTSQLTTQAQSVSIDAKSNNNTAVVLASAAASLGIDSNSAEKQQNSQMIAAVASGTSSSSSSNSSSDSDLTSYSESQLKEMVSNGEITQAQYNAEIQRRKETPSEDKKTATDTKDATEANDILNIATEEEKVEDGNNIDYIADPFKLNI